MSAPRILIVDDEIIIAREIEARLLGMGYEVPAIASSGLDAINQATDLRPDLILMDIVLKGDLDGIEAASEIRQPMQVPIIYVTAYTDKKTFERAKITEPFAYIVKPFSERELNANIEMALYKHRMETRFRKVERWFADAADPAREAVVVADVNGHIVNFNRGAEAITAWSRREAIGRRIEDVVRLVDRKNNAPLCCDDVSEGPVVCLAEETLLLDRTNERIPINYTTSILRDEANHPQKLVSVLRDARGLRHGAIATLNSEIALAVTQSLTLQTMLQQCAESMVRNLDAAFARIWSLTAQRDQLVLKASAGMYTHLDGAHGKIAVGAFKIGKIAKERKPHLTNDVANDPLIGDPEWAIRENMVAFAGYPLVVEDRLLGVIGMFARHTLPNHVLDALGSVAHNIAVGIERKRLEEQLRHSQKLDAVGQLAGGVAHDFNNLLTVISGYFGFLLGRDDLAEEARGQIEEIARAGDRAALLTRQLLTFSRKQVLEPRIVDLNVIVLDMEKILRRLIGEDVELAVKLETALEQVTADVGQLEQVIANLVVNSRDAMPQGGRITIETQNVDLDDAYSGIHSEVLAGRYVMLSVSDTGIGMPTEIVSRIFEPFFTTKEQGRGTGLGLSTVHGIVKQSGGHVGVYSEFGTGTVMKICLPITQKSVVPIVTTIEPTHDAVGTETILLVEDEIGVRKLATRILKLRGYVVLEASNGMEAVEIAENHKGPIHLVLTDVVMPIMAGRELADRLEVVRPDTKVLYMSGYTDDAVIRHGILEAEAFFVHKPFTPDSLAKKVREVLDGK